MTQVSAPFTWKCRYMHSCLDQKTNQYVFVGAHQMEAVMICNYNGQPAFGKTSKNFGRDIKRMGSLRSPGRYFAIPFGLPGCRQAAFISKFLSISALSVLLSSTPFFLPNIPHEPRSPSIVVHPL